MSYAAEVEVEFNARRGTYKVTVVEEEAQASSEFEVPKMPASGTIVSYKTTLVSGSGSTVNPKIGKEATFTEDTQGHVATNDTTDSHIRDQTPVRFGCDGSLFVRSGVDSGTDNVIHTELLITDDLVV